MRSSLLRGAVVISHDRARASRSSRSFESSGGRYVATARAENAVAVKTLTDCGGRASVVIQRPSASCRCAISRA